jgi:serine/threonine-protein kinase
MCRYLENLFGAWEEKKEKICALPAFPEPETGPGTGISFGRNTHETPAHRTRPLPVRSAPMKIPVNQAQAFFGLDRFMQPRKYGANDLVASENSVVTDRHTGLVWQQSGTGFPMTWHQAQEYVAQLNEQRFGGFAGWRLPTLHELLTLAVPPATGRDHCVSPVFDRTQKWLWSADKSTFVSAWYMSLEMGFAARNDLTGFYHIKAVRSDT